VQVAHKFWKTPKLNGREREEPEEDRSSSINGEEEGSCCVIGEESRRQLSPCGESEFEFRDRNLGIRFAESDTVVAGGLAA
jgi:hypothetical protein